MTQELLKTHMLAAAGFAMPPEWSPHAATWLGWPFDDAYWEGHLEAARTEFAELVRTIARFEPVCLVTNSDEAEKDARERLGDLSNISFFRLELNDIWFRDIGPLFIKDEAGRVAMTDWRFNGWGEKYPFEKDTLVPHKLAAELGMRRFEVPYVMEGGALDINGEGVCLTTRQCLLNQNRNPNLSAMELERILRDYLGVKHVVWLHNGLEGDKTDGHIDTLTRWANDHTVITSVCDENDTNYAALHENLTLLKTLRQPNGEPYTLIELPLPQKRMTLDGERLPLTYANFYIGNGFVVFPTYDDANDAQAEVILKAAFPEREVIGLPALGIITGGGAFHCLTQQHPEGEVYRGELT